MTLDSQLILQLIERLKILEDRIRSLVEKQAEKAYYTTAELAQRLGKAEFTVREWARLKRIRAEKQQSHRGPHAAWVVSHEEVLRIEREGLLPAT